MLRKGRGKRCRSYVERPQGLLVNDNILAKLEKTLSIPKLLRLSRVKDSMDFQLPNVTLEQTVLKRL